MIPGSNLLSIAFRAIAQTTVQWSQFQSRTINEIGMEVPTYASPISLSGSLQAVKRQKYQDLGLDFARFYYNFFCIANPVCLDRDVSGDLITFQSNNFQCVSSNPWYAIDGWVEVLLVRLP